MSFTDLFLETILHFSKLRPIQKMKVSNATQHNIVACDVEVAASSARRRKGLLGRDSLAPGEGLWITPCEAVHTFGMHFPIDLVYLDRFKRVKKIRSNIPSGRVSGCLFAHSVLELPAGTVEQTHIAPGDRLEFSMLPIETLK